MVKKNKSKLFNQRFFLVVIIALPLAAGFSFLVFIFLNIPRQFGSVEVGSKWVSSSYAKEKGYIADSQLIFKIFLEYNENKSKQLKINKVKIIDGYKKVLSRNTVKPNSTKYNIQLLGENDFLIVEKGINVPILLNADRAILLEKVPFDLTFGYSKKIKKARVIEVDSESVVSEFIINHEDKTIGLNNDDQVYFDLENQEKLAYAADQEKKISVVFISQGFEKEEIEKFDQEINNYKKKLREIEPFKSRKQYFTFYKLENYRDLGCKRGKIEDEKRMFKCDYYKIENFLEKAKIPLDVVTIVINDEYTGASQFDDTISISISNNCSKDICGFEGIVEEDNSLIFVHEFGHIFGLLDEYEYGEHYADIYKRYFKLNPYDAMKYNCSYKNPNKFWEQDISTEISYSKGCTLESLYRSAPNSIMRSTRYSYFSPAAFWVLNRELDKYLGIKTEKVNYNLIKEEKDQQKKKGLDWLDYFINNFFQD